MRLARATLDAVSPGVSRPAYDWRDQRPGIVHLGVGAFHRAHQAVYTDDALAAGDRDWRIIGVSLRSPTVRDALAPQDGLYTVVERGPGAAPARLIGAIDQVLVAPEDPEAVVAALADPDVHVVTLTVTEKGYYRNPADGGLLMEAPPIAAELAGGPPETVFGFLAAAFSRRQDAGLGGLTLVSCDNLPGNGRLLARLLETYLSRCDPALTDWVASSVRCVDTMVDRIVPAVTDREIAAAAAETGVVDAGLVVTEPFHQWVIEDAFIGPRPRWEAGGAQFVRDVRPFELAKLRLLNGAHSTLAYIGRALGHDFVHEAIADPDLMPFILAQLRRESAPSLSPAEGLDPDAYIAALCARFANDSLPHRLAQIANDGSQKIPQRWMEAMVERSARGETSPRHMLSLAAWIGFTRDFGGAEGSSDPLEHRFATLWRDAAGNLDALVDALAAAPDIFPEAFRSDSALIAGLRQSVRDWLTTDPRALLRALDNA